MCMASKPLIALVALLFVGCVGQSPSFSSTCNGKSNFVGEIMFRRNQRQPLVKCVEIPWEMKCQEVEIHFLIQGET